MSRNQLYIVGGAVLVIILAAVGYFYFLPGSTDGTIAISSPAAQKAGVTLLPDDRTLGSPKAPIVMIEYAAPSCPHCAAFDMEVFPLLKRQYIDTGKVFYIFRVFPISAVDGAAEAMARCLPADNYFPFIDLLFRNQKQWDPEYGVTDVHSALVQLGRVAGMSAEKVDQCIQDKAINDRTNRIAQEASTKYGVEGTPTFVINGVVQQAGEIPWPTLQNILNSQLAHK